MSLRDALRATVADCTPLQMQHATFNQNDATDYATTAQPPAASPLESSGSIATGHETTMQLGAATNATQAVNGEKLHVAFTGTRNLQPGPLTAHRLVADLLKASMRACDHHGDSQAARQQMRDECLALPADVQADLLNHFTQTYAISNFQKGPCRTPPAKSHPPSRRASLIE